MRLTIPILLLGAASLAPTFSPPPARVSIAAPAPARTVAAPVAPKAAAPAAKPAAAAAARPTAAATEQPITSPLNPAYPLLFGPHAAATPAPAASRPWAECLEAEGADLKKRTCKRWMP